MTFKCLVKHFDDMVVAGSAAVCAASTGLHFSECATTVADHPVDGAFGHCIADAYVHGFMIHE